MAEGTGISISTVKRVLNELRTKGWIASDCNQGRSNHYSFNLNDVGHRELRHRDLAHPEPYLAHSEPYLAHSDPNLAHSEPYLAHGEPLTDKVTDKITVELTAKTNPLLHEDEDEGTPDGEYRLATMEPAPSTTPMKEPAPSASPLTSTNRSRRQASSLTSGKEPAPSASSHDPDDNAEILATFERLLNQKTSAPSISQSEEPRSSATPAARPATAPAPTSATEYTPDFLSFWEAHTNRNNIKLTWQEWQTAITKTTAEFTIQQTKRYADHCKRKSPRFICYSWKWLKEERWHDSSEKTVAESCDEWRQAHQQQQRQAVLCPACNQPLQPHESTYCQACTDEMVNYANARQQLQQLRDADDIEFEDDSPFTQEAEPTNIQELNPPDLSQMGSQLMFEDEDDDLAAFAQLAR